MAVYRKKLVDKDGNTIIPAIGDIYGPVYTASLQSASGGTATYIFTPDTPVEANRVYAVKFPTATTNAVILLGDGNITASSILLTPVCATSAPIFEIARTTNINDTEVWLLMYNGSNQWVCLNQRTREYTRVNGTTSTSNPINMAYKYDDGRLVCLQRYDFSGKAVTSAWGSMYSSGSIMTMNDYAVEFTALPVLSITGTTTYANFWVATRDEAGDPSTTKPPEIQLVRPTSSTSASGAIHVRAEGFWK